LKKRKFIDNIEILKDESGNPYGSVCFRRYKNLMAVGVSILPPDVRGSVKFKARHSKTKSLRRAQQAMYFHLKGKKSFSPLNKVFKLDAKNAYNPQEMLSNIQIVMDDGMPNLVI